MCNGYDKDRTVGIFPHEDIFNVCGRGMSKPNKLTILPECPDCGAVARDPTSYHCASTPWSQSWTCLEDKTRRLQARITELEAIVDRLQTLIDATELLENTTGSPQALKCRRLLEAMEAAEAAEKGGGVG